jgi:hypothetical protein
MLIPVSIMITAIEQCFRGSAMVNGPAADSALHVSGRVEDWVRRESLGGVLGDAKPRR